MAEAEKVEQKEAVVEQPVVEKLVEPVIEAAPVIDVAAQVDDDDKEPGGSDPQAVRARKEYRARKRYEVALGQERDARIAAEARAQALAEARVAPKQPERRYTAAELQSAVDAGTISSIEAADYLGRVNAEAVAERVLHTERLRNDTETRKESALGIMRQYIDELPWINDAADPRCKILWTEYNKLTDPNGLYRLPKEPTTDILVLERMVGSLDKVRKAKEVGQRNNMHTENGAGGQGGRPPVIKGGAASVDKMPQHFKEYWDKTNTSAKDREIEAAAYWKRAEARKPA